MYKDFGNIFLGRDVLGEVMDLSRDSLLEPGLKLSVVGNVSVALIVRVDKAGHELSDNLHENGGILVAISPTVSERSFPDGERSVTHKGKDFNAGPCS